MRIFVATILFLSAASLLAQDAASSHAFDYDPKAPLNIQEAGVEHRGSVTIYDVSYASLKVGRVPAYLVIPEGKRPFAAVLWGHWYWRNSAFFNRKEFLEESVALAHAGVISLLPTGVGARPGHVDDRDELSDQQVTDLVQQIMDMRRGADLLLERKDVDPQRFAYVGHSYNATVGAFLSGIDKRFNAFVLMAGGLSDEVDFRSEEYKQFRQKYGPERFDEKIAKRAWLDPGKFVSHAAPAIVFLQYGTHDSPFLSPERARQYAANVSEPKQFKLYDAPHALNAEARRDRMAFLCQQLKLKPLDPSLMASIPDLPQPPDPAP